MANTEETVSAYQARLKAHDAKFETEGSAFERRLYEASSGSEPVEGLEIAIALNEPTWLVFYALDYMEQRDSGEAGEKQPKAPRPSSTTWRQAPRR
jgi:hypothetical protein